MNRFCNCFPVLLWNEACVTSSMEKMTHQNVTPQNRALANADVEMCLYSSQASNSIWPASDLTKLYYFSSDWLGDFYFFQENWYNFLFLSWIWTCKVWKQVNEIPISLSRDLYLVLVSKVLAC